MQISAHSALDKIVGIGKAQPSKLNPGGDTSGDIPFVRDRDPVRNKKLQAAQQSQLVNQGAMGGLMSGLMTGFPLGGVEGALTGGISGMAGGLVGASVGFKAQSTGKAIAAGSLTGAGVAVIAHLGLRIAFNALTGAGLHGFVPMAGDLATTSALALLGGMNGAAGAMAASRRAAPRDAAYGGWGAGLMAARITGNPMMMAAGAAAGSVAGKAKTATGRALLGLASGAGIGALTSLPYFLAGNPAALQFLTTGAIAGAAVGTAGAVVGPVVRQAIRNATDLGVGNFNEKVVDPFLAKHPLGTGGTMAAAAALGALTLGSLGTLAPTIGLPLLPTVGVLAAAGAGKMMWKVHSAMHVKEQIKEIQKPENLETLNQLAAQYKGIATSLHNIKKSA